MVGVEEKPGEDFESLFRRFKKAVERSGILADLKKHEFYEKPSVKKKRKKLAAQKRALKRKFKDERFQSKMVNGKNFKFNKDRTKKIPTKPFVKDDRDKPRQQPNQQKG